MGLLEENNDEADIEYFIEICQILKQVVDQKMCWDSFKEVADLRSVAVHRIVRRLVKEKYFNDSVFT